MATIMDCHKVWMANSCRKTGFPKKSPQKIRIVVSRN